MPASFALTTDKGKFLVAGHLLKSARILLNAGIMADHILSIRNSILANGSRWRKRKKKQFQSLETALLKPFTQNNLTRQNNLLDCSHESK